MCLAQLHSPYGPYESEGDPECIFFTLNTYQATYMHIGDVKSQRHVVLGLNWS